MGYKLPDKPADCGMVFEPDYEEETDEESEFSCKDCTGYSEIDEESFTCTRRKQDKGVIFREYSVCDFYDEVDSDEDINDKIEFGMERE